ncbi:MAG: Clp protease N-terminal domain-containing protein, partial [Terriglobia bacterium]
MPEKLTLKSQEALGRAERLAQEYGHQEIDADHLFLGLLQEKEGIVLSLLKLLEVDSDDATRRTTRALEGLPRVEQAAPETFPGRRLKAVLNFASREASRLKDEFISTEHLLAGIVEAGGEGSDLLKEANVTVDRLYEAVAAIKGSERVTDPSPEEKYKALELYGRDLTELAEAGKLDPVIGRDDEIRRIMQILSRRTKN